MKSTLSVLSAALLVMVMAGGVGTTAQSPAAPTFNKDVAPIIFNNCATCHRPNQVAPMSLLSYKEVRPWARAIKDKVVKRQMPPWFADPRFGEFRNDRRLSDEQIQTLTRWADAGAPEGDTPLTAQVPSDNPGGWTHPSGRPPDVVISMAEAFNAPAEGELPNFNIYQDLPEELKKEDHFIEAIQVLPGVVPAMHHTQFTIKPMPAGTRIGAGEAWPGGPVIQHALIDEKSGKVYDGRRLASEAAAVEGTGGRKPLSEFNYCCYVPGGSFRQYRDGGGQRIPSEGKIIWGLHYTMIGKPFADQTRVGMWFQRNLTHEIKGNAGQGRTQVVLGRELIDSAETPLRREGGSGNGSPSVPVIPPNTKDWAITAITTYQDDITLYLVWPHMHTRGHDMTYVLTYPDGREQVLLSVPKFDFNWQIFYELKEPLKVPAGSTIKTVGSYDNSTANKWNAAPHKEVYWSEQSWDEMYNGFRDYSIDKLDIVATTKSPASSKPATAGGGQ